MYACQNCDYKTDNLESLDHATHLHTRVAPGELMPAGQCPECGALCRHTDGDTPRIVIEVRGGCVVAVYGTTPGVPVEIVDYDEDTEEPDLEMLHILY